MIQHNKVTKGDIGTVLGPCTSAVADKADRILVDFGGEKGRVNIHKTEVQRELRCSQIAAWMLPQI